MRSPRGLLGAIVLLLTFPIAVLTQILLGSGSGVAMHVSLAVGCVLVSFSAFDFETPRWIAWIGCASAGAFAAIFLLGRRFQPRANALKLICGGVVGAILFYLITNTAAWLFNPFANPEYVNKTLASWFMALTKGVGSWPQTWEFFRNTLMSSGLFTALFVGAMKYSEHLESAAEKKAAEATPDADDPEGEPEEAKAGS